MVKTLKISLIVLIFCFSCEPKDNSPKEVYFDVFYTLDNENMVRYLSKVNNEGAVLIESGVRVKGDSLLYYTNCLEIKFASIDPFLFEFQDKEDSRIDKTSKELSWIFNKSHEISIQQDDFYWNSFGEEPPPYRQLDFFRKNVMLYKSNSNGYIYRKPVLDEVSQFFIANKGQRNKEDIESVFKDFVYLFETKIDLIDSIPDQIMDPNQRVYKLLSQDDVYNTFWQLKVHEKNFILENNNVGRAYKYKITN